MRGRLRIYLGAAPGVGKTFAMLNEGWRRKERGTDVVVGYVETHGRPKTAEQLRDLDVVPRRAVEYRGAALEEMDVDAILARRPQVALVDELAHTDVPGSRNEKRWQDVEELLEAGIDVITTVNVQHLESLNDVVERITGVPQRETVPDAVVRAADQIELVDMAPEALRRRMAHGNIYRPEKVDAALGNYFRVGNLTALRELALLWVADRVDDALEEYREREGIAEPWETRERVLVTLTGAPGGEALIRRAARMAQRANGKLLGLHVRNDDGLSTQAPELLVRHRRMLEELEGEYHEVVGSDVGRALVDFARAENATQVVLGASRRSRTVELVRGSVINRVVRMSGAIDVHVISHQPTSDEEGLRRAVRRRRLAPLSPRRRALGAAIGLVGLPLLTLVLTSLGNPVGLPTDLLLYLLLVVVIAAVGGVVPAMAGAICGFLLVNWYFTPPVRSWSIADGENLSALVVFLVVGGVVSGLVDLAARRTTEALRARAEAEALARLAGTMTHPDPLPALMSHLRSTFALDAVALLIRDATGGRSVSGGSWRVEAAEGEPVPVRPQDADATEFLTDDIVLVMTGHHLGAEDRQVLNAFSAQLAVALESRRLQAEAATVSALADANDLRTALLQAVSHDLRTPLSSIKASVTSLRQGDVQWSQEQAGEFLATIDEETDRLSGVVGNLLDMSRLQAGALRVAVRPVGLEEVVPAALASLGDRARAVEVDVAETLPPVLADPALLERALANLIDNAATWSPADAPAVVEAGAVAGRVDLRIEDRGPGIPVADRARVFQPFQRLGDRGNSAGVGLGLAVARGFIEAMGAELEIEDTPGGGVTMVVRITATEPDVVSSPLAPAGAGAAARMAAAPGTGGSRSMRQSSSAS